MGPGFWEAVGVGCAMFAASVVMAVVVMASVALGAWIVYKTKREDTLFTRAPGEGDVMVAPGELDDGLDIPMGEDTSRRVAEDAMDVVSKHTARFLRQAETKGGVRD